MRTIEMSFRWLCGKCRKKYKKQIFGHIMSLHKRGLSYGEISRMTGIPKSTIYDMVIAARSANIQKRTIGMSQIHNNGKKDILSENI